MLIQTISQYLESNKRLVIPQLGAFIVKEAGRNIVFTEMLKRDDGVLRALLREKGANEIEAAGEIDRFVFEVRHAVQQGGEYRLEKLGAMKPGPNGTIVFVYEPGRKPAARTAVPQPAEQSSVGTHIDVDNPKVSPSAKLNPEPYVKGLRYGKPNKSTAPYTYVDGRRRKRGDRFVWIALIAVFFALSVIAFGWWSSSQNEEADVEVSAGVTSELPQPESTATE